MNQSKREGLKLMLEQHIQEKQRQEHNASKKSNYFKRKSPSCSSNDSTSSGSNRKNVQREERAKLNKLRLEVMSSEVYISRVTKDNAVVPCLPKCFSKKL